MICAGPARVFVPLGRELSVRHPEEAHLVSSSKNARHSDLSFQLLDTLKDFSIHTDTTIDAGAEKWIMREWSDGEWHFEEELYFARRTAIWSRGTNHGRWDLHKTFTVDSPIQQALWCDFFIAENKPSVIDDSVDPSQGEYFSAVCVLDGCSISIFETNGQDFITPLPFQVKKLWPTKFGLLIERQPIPSDSITPKSLREGLPILFTLLHPLDEITPVVCNKVTIQGGVSRSSHVTDQNLHVVHTDLDLSLVITFDSFVGAHSVWKLQRTSDFEDGNLAFTVIENRTPNVMSHVGCSTPLPAHIARRFKQASATPLRVEQLFGSPAGASWAFSPNISSKTQRAAISRSQTPTCGNPFDYLATPSPSMPASQLKKGIFQVQSCSHVTQSCTFSRFRDPLSADVSLELLWTESSKTLGKCGPASKVFFTNDFTKQRFLCLLIPSKSQLRFVRIEESNDLQQIIFGITSSISAKDVAPLEGSDLILVLDPQLCLVIYSGVTKVAKIILKVPSNLQRTVSTSAMSFLSPECLKSGVVTSSRPPSALEARFDEEVHLLSPVPTENTDGSINMSTDDSPQFLISEMLTGLRDPVRNKVTVVHSSGALYRFSVPVVASSCLVNLCLSAVQKVVPREYGMQLRIKWYCARFAPGSGDTSPSSDWATFTCLLLGCIGYNVDKLRFEWCQPCNEPRSPDVNLKKLKVSSSAQNQDWEDLIATNYHQNSSLCLSDGPKSEHGASSGFASFNKSCSFFNQFVAVFSALHLVYEELKLNTLMSQEINRLCILLQMLARDLRLNTYYDYYVRDFPHIRLPCDYVSQVDESIFLSINFPVNFPADPPSIYVWLNNILRREPISPFPYLHPILKRTRDVCLLYAALLGHLSTDADNFEKFLYPIGANLTTISNLKMLQHPDIGSYNCYEFAVVYMAHLGVTLTELKSLPSGVVLMLWNALYQCRENPPMTWPRNIFLMLGREDLATHTATKDQEFVRKKSNMLKNVNLPEKSTVVGENKKAVVDDDGMQELDEEVLKLRFNNDLRINEVRRLLQSSRPVKITVVQQPEVSDHEFIDEQERSLYAYCIRTMAIPVGRGIFTVRTTRPIPTETLPIPKLCLTGKAPPRNATVDLTHIEVPANMNLWPSFHNGVAAGLKVIPNSLGVDSAWIIYNKSRANNDLPTEHAGLLMGLGLNGHLSSLANPNIYNYVSKGQEMTSVGLMLGLAASKRGTMDPNATNLLSIHVDSLLPPTAMELDVPQSVRVAAILGIGLLYEGTAHRHTSEVLLSEIGRPPGPEMENSTDRESYSLAAGLALGLVTFGKGNSSEHVLDMSMASHLCHYMVGGNKHPSVTMGPLKEKYKAPSYQIKEGSAVNIDVTSPGATLALGMMFFASGKRAVAEWMAAPDTQHLLDFVRPDFLLLRTLSKCLILWDEIVPNCAWVESHMPYIISSVAFKTEKPIGDVDFETMRQAYCNILAGACMALGLRFAGSANAEAYNTLMKYMQKTIQLLSHVILEQTGKTTVETCLNVIVLSLAMVMAGTGDLEVLRICRYLRSRIGPSHSHVLYGSHMAVHMALGLLFLGGGMYTLSTAPSAIAALICALYPKFPAHSNDNRYHLQAFRHLYVLAVEPRLLIPRDVISGNACYVHLLLKFKDTVWYKNVVLKLKAPALLPELRLLEQVSVCDPRYLPIVFQRGKNWKTLRSILTNNGALFVKQKTGCLSYVEDPQGYRTLLSQNLVKESFATWVPKPEAIPALTSDPAIRILSGVGIKEASAFSVNNIEPSTKERIICNYVGRLLYESVSHEKMETFPALISLSQVIDKCCTGKASAMDLWQLKLAFSFAKRLDVQNGNPILRPEIIIALESQMECFFNSWIEKGTNAQLICHYLQGCFQSNQNVSPELANYLTFYNIPYPRKLANVGRGERSLPQLALELAHLQLEPKTILNIFNMTTK